MSSTKAHTEHHSKKPTPYSTVQVFCISTHSCEVHALCTRVLNIRLKSLLPYAPRLILVVYKEMRTGKHDTIESRDSNANTYLDLETERLVTRLSVCNKKCLL